MENKMNRVIRACIEMRKDNPILSIHDQGAGGNGNVLKEICNPLGMCWESLVMSRCWDRYSQVDRWRWHYVCSRALGCWVPGERRLPLRPQGQGGDRGHCQERERSCHVRRYRCWYVQLSALHRLDTGRVKVVDTKNNQVAVDVDLSLVLGDMPKKTFVDTSVPLPHQPLDIPSTVSVMDAVNRVFRLVSVGSKRFLTNKVDRSVTGLIAQQQVSLEAWELMSSAVVLSTPPFLMLLSSPSPTSPPLVLLPPLVSSPSRVSSTLLPWVVSLSVKLSPTSFGLSLRDSIRSSAVVTGCGLPSFPVRLPPCTLAVRLWATLWRRSVCDLR